MSKFTPSSGRKSIRFANLFVVAIATCAAPAAADEGMWPFNRLPKDLVKSRHGFEPSDSWLEHVRLSSVRFNSGGSGSFVSAGGLVLTNHHVGADCIQKLGKKGKDLIADGFYAKSSAEEEKCPDLELNVLVGIDDVTAQIKAVAVADQSPAQVNQAQKEAMARIEKSCSETSGLRCDVVTLYQGGLYDLYKYKKYTDVRLVFAPEAQIAFYGGDPDNFTFPRYDFDMAIFRAYDAGKPLQPQHFLQWSTTAKDGDLVFTSGHPGNTSRSFTTAQLGVLRDLAYTFRLAQLSRIRSTLVTYSNLSPEAERQAKTPIFGTENGLKALQGYKAAVQNPRLFEAVLKRETELRSDPKAAAAIDSIAQAQQKYLDIFARYQITEGFTLQTKLFAYARHLVRMGAEMQLPSDKRLREYRDSNRPSLELSLFSAAPVYRAMEQALLADALRHVKRELKEGDPIVKAACGSEDADMRAYHLLTETKLADPNERKRLAHDFKALAESKDPLIVLAQQLDPEARQLRKVFEDEVEAPMRQAQGVLAQAMFAKYGSKMYPDATFTLRLSFGKIAGYPEDDGTAIAPITTLGGLYARADKAANKHPWNLPKSWADARPRVKADTPFNVASSNDIIGGNSGSPVVDKEGKLVGLIFDGNIQSLAGQFGFDDKQNRAVWVHTGALLEGLRKVYMADRLADEMQGTGEAKK